MNLEKKLIPYKNIFLDRDGIINNIIMRDEIVSSPRTLDEFQFTDHIFEFVESLHKEKKEIFVVSNQPDIARKKMDISELNKMTKKIEEELKIENIAYCIHDDEDCCNCRKPKPGLINNFMKEFNLISAESILIGDSHKDIEAAKNANISSILLSTYYNSYIENSIEYTHISSLKDLL